MIVDGNKIAADIFVSLQEKITRTNMKVVLVVIVVGKNPATETFIALKKKKAEEVGVVVHIVRFPDDVAEQTLCESIQKSSKDPAADGIVVQLPLPRHINNEAVLSAILPLKDVDVLSPKSIKKFREGTLDILPPVVGAIAEILKRESVSVKGKNVVVIGKGALVGEPTARWFTRQGAHVTVLDRETKNISATTKDADIIVLGAGVPGLLTPDMLTSGVILFDAGTSESAGKLKGDADPECAKKCSIFTPVPGGIGPITIAVLLRNVVKRSLSRA